jgi:ABC-type Na+ transport system ATPase subunit NatA
VPSIGTVLFFCTLREALLNTLLLNHLRSQKVPTRLIERLLEDNKLAGQKFGELFTSVIGVKWKVAVSHASSHTSIDFEPVSNLMLRAAEIRNEFLHEGRGWGATLEFATECMNSMPALVGLFVALHNGYVHPMLRGDF